MNPERPVPQAQRRIPPAGETMDAMARLDSLAAQLMAVQRQWHDPQRAARLAAALASSRSAWHDIQSALAAGALALPLEVRQNLLILSVYADSKIAECETAASADALGRLIALTHALAGSLRDRREAA